MRAILAVLLLLTLAFAGCASKGGGNGDGDGSDAGTATGTSTGTKSGSTTKSGTGTSSSSQTGTGSASNKAPLGTVGATVNGTSVKFTLTGSDADNDTLSWALAFGDGASQNGTALPSNVTHTFAVGNYTARYNLTDGKATSRYNVTVTVAAASGGGLSFAGDVENFCAFCTEVLGEQDGSEPASPFPSVSWASGEQGTDAVWVEIPANLIGHTYAASTTGADIALAAFTECGPEGGFIEMVDTGAIPETGTVPAGTGCIVLWEYFSWLPPPISNGPSMPGGVSLSLVVA